MGHHEHDGRDLRSLFLTSYQKAYGERVQQQRDLFSHARTGLNYSENEIQSSLRAHAGQMHVDAALRAARMADKLSRRGKTAGIADGQDVEAIAADFKRRTDAIHDPRLWDAVNKSAKGYM